VTYAAFLLALVLLPITALAALPRRLPRGSGRVLALVAAAALVYTTPWDNYLVASGIWTYGPDRVVGRIGYVPVEEYAFFVLQPFLVGLLFLRLLRVPSPTPMPPYWRPVLVGGWLAAAGAGAAMLAVGPDSTRYAGLILAWAGPLLAGLSVLGARHVWQHRRAAAIALAGASLYLWAIDRLAIGVGIWSIAPRFSLGTVLGLPVEEALFFSVTSWLCIQAVAMLLPESEST